MVTLALERMCQKIRNCTFCHLKTQKATFLQSLTELITAFQCNMSKDER